MKTDFFKKYIRWYFRESESQRKPRLESLLNLSWLVFCYKEILYIITVFIRKIY